MQLQYLRHSNNVNCCCVIDESRLLIGCEDLMLCCDLDVQTYQRIAGSKRIQQLVYTSSDQLIVALAGKQKNIKLLPIRGLDSENVEWIKIPETKNATCFVLAKAAEVTMICVAIKKNLIVYEINRRKQRHSFWRDIQMPLNVQTLDAHNELVAVGTNSNFVVYNVFNRDQPPLCK